MSANSRNRARVNGFSLIELMVGVAIGMLGILVMMQISVVFEARRRTTTSGSDAQIAGMSALFVLERDLRGAGYGLSRNDAVGCSVRRSFKNADATTLVMAPVTIVDGANGRPDIIRMLASSKANWSLPSALTSDFAVSANDISVTSTLGMGIGDLLVLYETGKACALIEVTGLPSGNLQLSHVTAGSKWNPATPSTVFPTGGYNRGALAINMGKLSDHTYRLDNQNTLLLDTYASDTNSSGTRNIASDIVNLQAQYGFDTRSGSQLDTRVDKWSSVMLDADGNGTTGNSGDYARIVAVRVALAARSAMKEKPGAANTCDATVNFPTWMADADATGALTATAIDVSKNSDGSANADWKCYRYKVFETVVPLRNLIWRDR